MKKFLLMQTVILLSSFVMSPLFSQSTDYIDKAYQFLGNNYGLDKASIGELRITDQVYSDHNQVTHIHFAQTYNGLEIFNTHFNLAFQPNGKVSASGHRLKTFKSFPSITNTPSIEAPQAIGIVASEIGITSRSTPTYVKETKSGKPVYSKGDIALQDIPVELGYHLSSQEFHLAYRMNIESAKNGQLYEFLVDAIDSKILATTLLTLHCSFEHGYLAPQENCDNPEASYIQAPPTPPSSALGTYRVLPLTVESPNHGSFELVSGVNDPLASPFGWHDVDGEEGHEYTYTRGNNVHAFLDRNWDYNSDMEISGGAGLVFDFPYNPNAEPSGNRHAGVTNLFYWNNIMHDFAYHYGFNEIAGNFQDLNYSGSGKDEDYVEAHAQHGDNDVNACGNQDNGGEACMNNANFSTPNDGFNGRMKVFTWDRNSSSKLLDVLAPVEVVGKILTGIAHFGDDITTIPVTGLVEIADAANSNSTQGCSPLTDEVDYNGKIVIIDRGICDYSEKVFHAQEAGAIGVIICNFEEIVVAMGAGENAELVTIPSVLIAYSDCQRIRVAAANGLRVSLVSPPPDGGPARRDGAVDNSVIAHEYAHGISNRLTGGPDRTNCLTSEEAKSLGEGWSDFFALVATAKAGDTGAKRRGMGTFVSKESTEGRGLRTFPYSTDLNENPHTFEDVLFESRPHGVGTIWAAMLWDLYWALSDAYGWDPNLYTGTGGNNIAIQLVMDGLKLQPCNPGFIDARNAILQADEINNNGLNLCLIWEVFARRGLGWNADGGDSLVVADAIAGFQSLPPCIKELKLSKSMTEEIVAGDPIEVRLHAINHTDGTLTNVTIEDNISNGTSYIAGSANIEPVTGNSLVWIVDEMTPGEEVEIVYQLQSDPANHSIKIEYDDIEGDAYARWDIDYDPDKTIDNAWLQEDLFTRNGSGSWKVGDVETESDHRLHNLEAYDIGGTYPVYRFYHYFDTEAGADGGFVEITKNNGVDWIPLADKVFRNGYVRRLQYVTFAIPDLYAFSGLSSTDQEWIPVYIDLRDYIGQDVKIRYRFGTDANTPGDGWYIDDVELMDAVIYNSTACIVSDQTPTICAEAPERGTIVDSQIASGTVDVLDNTSLLVHPNPAGDYVQIALSAELTEDARLSVFDLTGKVMHTIEWNLTEGINQHLLELSGYTPGMYVVQIQTTEGIYSKKFVRK